MVYLLQYHLEHHDEGDDEEGFDLPDGVQYTRAVASWWTQVILYTITITITA